MPTLNVNLGKRSYNVVCEYGVVSEVGERIKQTGLEGKCALISDETVSELYSEKLKTHLESVGYDVTLHIVAPGEASKSLVQVETLCREMTQVGHDRQSFVVALGGGVVGDLAGFVASVFYRGIPFVQVPTTIVSLVDSSVGGKTGVNLVEGKNLVGAFHQPRLVLADPETLKTLAPREYREGYAEVIKHALIRDAEMLSELEQLDPGDNQPPASLIARNIAIKARIVEEDEEEKSGTRALLNFGHTIGHGIEASVPYGILLHGEAISLGIVAALRLSVKFSSLSEASAQRVVDLLEKYELPTKLDDSIKTQSILEKLQRDKKFNAGQIQFILLEELGAAFVSKEITIADLSAAIESLRG